MQNNYYLVYINSYRLSLTKEWDGKQNYAGSFMQKSVKLLIFIGFIMLILSGFLVICQLLLFGSSTSLFHMSNNVLQSHEVTVEIFDVHNESIFKEKYLLAPDDRVSHQKPTWLLLQLSIPPGNKEEYTFKATLDDNITKTHRFEVEMWNTLDIKIRGYDAESPMSMGVETV